MFQRLLILLMVLFISGSAMSQDVMTPNDGDYIYDPNAAPNSLTNPTPAANGIVQKWVHDPTQKPGRITWDQSQFKSYRLSGFSYRVRFPKNYNPANKYPIVIFLHGAGEACDVNNSRNANGTDRENQDQLFWGAQDFSSRIDNDEWNGFLLFPQLYSNASQWPDLASINPVNNFLDKLIQYNGVDQDRVIVMGLSAGGCGTIFYGSSFPTRIATIISSAPEFISGQVSAIPNFLQIPVWLGAGGTDSPNGCDPINMLTFQDNFINQGGNIYTTYSVNEGHVMWNTQWFQKDVSGKSIMTQYWNSAHKAQPLLYFQKNQFCAGQPISAKMGLSPGLGTYEWQVDNGSGFTTIPGATSNIYTATAVGTYRVHFKRTGSPTFSDWTPVPVVISANACSTDTAFVEHFDYHRDWTSAQAYKPYSFGCQNGIVTSGTDGKDNNGSISQDGTGVFGGKFLLNSTTSACTYTSTDQIWRNYLYPVNVQSNTTYTLSFSIANQNNYFNGNTDPANAAAITATINNSAVTPAGGVKAKGTGNSSWKKYSFTWNSGGASNPELALVNNTSGNLWNDFVVDEISLVKYKAPAMPGAAFSNVTLWAKANSLNYSDNAGVGLWTNTSVNGDNLAQPTSTALPVFKNNGTDNINFNPVVNFAAANGQFMQAKDGFSSTLTHTAVTAYVVAKFSTLTQDDKNIFIENQTASGGQQSVRVTLRNNGKLSWTAGKDPDYVDNSNTITTPNNTIEADKPIVWSFSKDNNNTASGNKQDIRKNGLVVATGNNTFTFTGNNQPFGLSNGGQFFSGKVAEVIYLLDATVTPLIQNKIESYLAIKYGTTMGSTTTPINYTASDGTTIFWPASTTYQNDVFGIGTDSASGLVQTKSNSVNSGSGDGTGQFAKGNLVLSTNTTLLDKRFLMIGNDAGSLTQVVIAPGQAPASAVGKSRINRNWKVANAGTTQIATVDLSFDTTGLFNLAGGPVLNQYALMIDKDGDNTPYNTTVTYVTATGIVGKKLIFSNVNLPNNAIFTIITNNLTSALPATWLGFTAEAVNGNGLLNWKTSDEVNVDRYVVEHSFDGISFTAIASVTANNNSGVNNYTYTDNGLAAGTHYYRIRRVDKDGKSEYTDIKTIKITISGANVVIRPNPVVGSILEMAISVPQTTKTSVQIMTVEGKLMLKQDIKLTTGNNLVKLNIDFVPSGIYLLQVQLNNEVVTKKFIRQH